ncbi:MAG: LptF/LptG family permease [Pseudomonadota bacterium]
MIETTLAERYLMERTFRNVVILGAASFALIVSIDFLEALRQVSNRPEAGVGTAATLTLLRAPQLLMILSPFIMLFGTLMAMAQMARSLEIAVLRAAGFSVWRLVGAPVVLALMIGTVLAVAVDPLTTRMSLSSDNLLNEVRGSGSNAEKTFRRGVWLRQEQEEGVILIHADRVLYDEDVMESVFVWKKRDDGAFVERFDADKAVFRDQQLTLIEAMRSAPGGDVPTIVGDVTFDTTFELDDLVLANTRPESLSLWTLPGLMQRIGGAGVPLEPFSLRLHELFAMPLKLAAMAVIGCVFALPIHARSGGTFTLIIYGIFAGFAAFIAIQFSSAVAEAGLVPVRIAAWTPPSIALLIGVTVLLFREDG